MSNITNPVRGMQPKKRHPRITLPPGDVTIAATEAARSKPVRAAIATFVLHPDSAKPVFLQQGTPLSRLHIADAAEGCIIGAYALACAKPGDPTPAVIIDELIGMGEDAVPALALFKKINADPSVCLHEGITNARFYALKLAKEIIAAAPVEDAKAAKKERDAAERKRKRAARQERMDHDLSLRGLPIIETNNRQLNQRLNEFSMAISKANKANPQLFRGITGLVMIEYNKDGLPVIVPVSCESLQVFATSAAEFISTTAKDGPKHVSPPREVCETFLSKAGQKHWRNIPPLDSIATSPFVDGGGRICSEPGYHPLGRVFLHLPLGFILPDITPTPDNIAQAKALILETILGEVAFADRASKANAVALMFLPFIQQLIDDISPAHVVDAPTQSSGKTYCALCCTTPFGKVVPSSDMANNEESRKALVAKLSAAAWIIFLDNVKSPLSDATMQTAITSPELEARLLGTPQNITVKTNVVWVFTSNNANLDPDTISRCVMIRLDTNQENPESRAFKGDPLNYIAQNRPQVAGAILTLINAWLERGVPDKSGPTVSRFTKWERIIGGILEVNEIPGFLEGHQESRGNMNSEGSAWGEFVTRWHEDYGTKYMPTRPLLQVARQCEELSATIGDKEEISFGRMLLSRRDKVFAGLKITRLPGRARLAQWRVQPVQNLTLTLNTEEDEPEDVRVERDKRDNLPYAEKLENSNTTLLEEDKNHLLHTHCENPHNPSNPQEIDDREYFPDDESAPAGG